MANARMYLECVLCDDRFYLAKWYPTTGWYAPSDGTPQEDAMNAWFDEHDAIHGEHGGREASEARDAGLDLDSGEWYRLVYN